MLVGSQVIKFYYYGHSSTLPNGGSTFAIDYPAVASIPASSLEHDSVATINPVPFSCGTGNIIWGTALLNWDGYVYIYGWRSTGIGSDGTYLARASAANLAVSKAGQAPAWQVYDGMSGQNPVWGSCASTPAALAINGTTGFSVDAVNGSLWLVQFDYTHGQANAAGAIGAHPSATPWGFGNNTVALYTPPTGVVAIPVLLPGLRGPHTAGTRRGRAGRDLLQREHLGRGHRVRQRQRARRRDLPATLHRRPGLGLQAR